MTFTCLRRKVQLWNGIGGCRAHATWALDGVDELVLQRAQRDVGPLRHVEDLVRQAALRAPRLLHLPHMSTSRHVPLNLDGACNDNEDEIAPLASSSRQLWPWSSILFRSFS